MRSILIGLLLIPPLWGQKTEWTVRYVAGPYRAAEGRKMPLEVLPDRVVLNGHRSIPVNAITELAYQRVSFQRFEPLMNAAGGDPLVGSIAAAMLIGSAVMTNTFDEMPQGYQHRIHLIWFESGRANRLTIEASKREYRALLAALARVTGRPWKDFYDLPPERQVRRTAPLDPAAQEAVVRGVQASLGRHAPVPAHLAPGK